MSATAVNQECCKYCAFNEKAQISSVNCSTLSSAMFCGFQFGVRVSFLPHLYVKDLSLCAYVMLLFILPGDLRTEILRIRKPCDWEYKILKDQNRLVSVSKYQLLLEFSLALEANRIRLVPGFCLVLC